MFPSSLELLMIVLSICPQGLYGYIYIYTATAGPTGRLTITTTLNQFSFKVSHNALVKIQNRNQSRTTK